MKRKYLKSILIAALAFAFVRGAETTEVQASEGHWEWIWTYVPGESRDNYIVSEPRPVREAAVVSSALARLETLSPVSAIAELQSSFPGANLGRIRGGNNLSLTIAMPEDFQASSNIEELENLINLPLNFQLTRIDGVYFQFIGQNQIRFNIAHRPMNRIELREVETAQEVREEIRRLTILFERGDLTARQYRALVLEVRGLVQPLPVLFNVSVPTETPIASPQIEEDETEYYNGIEDQDLFGEEDYSEED
ncbi:MAG: hypothetical protein FWF50_04810 [Defluviitaleaceae bacterium]|nr:hypothetical protein [Defluviitaleaceae bacterium]